MYLCDDVAAMRVLLRAVLEIGDDVEVVGESGDGRTALDDLERLRPDVLVLDISLPELDGLEVLEGLPSRSPSTRVVVFSGYAAQQLEATTLALGADCYIEKGADIEAVAEAVRSAARAAA